MKYLSAAPEVVLTAPGPKGARISLHVKGTHVPHRRAYTVTLTPTQERTFAEAVHDLIGEGVLRRSP